MTSPSNVVFPNPDTYLNHLSPQEAYDYEATRNVLLVLLGKATIWDILVTISDDIKILRRSRFRSVIFCFIFSRFFAVVFVITHVICRIATIGYLNVVAFSGVILCGLSIGCSSFLFLQRARAVYADRPRVQQFFTILWMIYVISETILVFAIKPVYIQGTRQFKDSGIQPVMSLLILVSVIYDSSIFLAISYKISIAHVIIDREMGWKRYILGKALPRFSQAVLQSGQQYYLLVFLVFLPSGIVLYIPSTPPIFKSTLAVIIAPLMASMSCRIYRNIKLFKQDVTTPYPISEIQFM